MALAAPRPAARRGAALYLVLADGTAKLLALVDVRQNDIQRRLHEANERRRISS